MTDCRKCQRFNACYLDNDDCIGFVPKTMTNGDRIRAMTDEEIADWYWDMPKVLSGYTDSRLALIEWLKKEVEDD